MAHVPHLDSLSGSSSLDLPANIFTGVGTSELARYLLSLPPCRYHRHRMTVPSDVEERKGLEVKMD